MLAEYRDKFWFPSGTLAVRVPGRVFLHDTNVFASLFSDATGTTPLPNPLTTTADGYLTFWAEEGQYWLHIGYETFEIWVGPGGSEGATEGWVLTQIGEAEQRAAVDASAKANLAEANAIAEAADAVDAAEQRAAVDASAKANLAEANAEGEAADALAAHAAQTTDVHGIADTSDLVTRSGG